MESMAKIVIRGIPHAYDLTVQPTEDSRPALVFIHGWLLSRHYWQPLVAKLAPNYRCLTYDLRGFGESGGSPVTTASTAYSLAAYATDLLDLLAALEIEQAWVIGHSLGGSIALWAAARAPHAIAGTIGVNAGGGIYLKEEFERFRAAGQRIATWRPKWLRYIPLLDWVFTRAMVVQPLARHWGRQRLLDFIQADTAAALGSLLESTTEAEVHRLPQLVARLDQPAYFLAGAQDTVMETKYVRHLASFHRLFQQGQENAVEIADCGHLAMVEQPDAVNAAIQTILARHVHQPQSTLSQPR
ncbi:MAG: alpha/beta hydrolase [Spirulinaceae cyanobacterium SM2_1_0]|nr:alpha/beta hydrolase [Spirulinaceae cyanobacterium SM2_1_0]